MFLLIPGLEITFMWVRFAFVERELNRFTGWKGNRLEFIMNLRLSSLARRLAVFSLSV